MDERDFNYKSAIPLPTYSEPESRNLQPLNPKSLANKRWGTAGSTPAFSSSMLPSMQAAPAAAPSSLCLFTGWGPAGSLGSSHVDWNTGGLAAEFDYTLDSNLVSSKSNGLWLGLSSLLRNTSTSGTRTSRTNSSFLSGLHDSGLGKETPSSVGSQEWTSPFAGKDMFSLPRQVVTSPSPWY